MKRSRSPSYRDRSPRKYRRSHSPPSRRDQDDYRSRRSQRDDWNRKSYREDRRDRYESPKREEKDDKMIEQKEDTSELIPQKPQNLSVLHTHAQPQVIKQVSASFHNYGLLLEDQNTNTQTACFN